MTSDSKIRFFLFTLVLGLTLSSCSKNKNDVIPDVYVYFTLDLNDPQFVNLNAVGGSYTIDYNTNNMGPGAAGFDGNGIIIYSGQDEFYAYDRTCPHDYAVNGLSIKVNIDITHFTMAVCPECGTYYALAAGGVPYSGIGRYPLKNYKTRLIGNQVEVQNY